MRVIQSPPDAVRGRGLLIGNGEHVELAVWEDGRKLASAVTGIDRRAVRLSGEPRGHFFQFEALDRPDAARLLFQSMADWQRGHGMYKVFGPVAPDGGGFGMGVEVSGFGLPGEILMPENPPYYDALIRHAGFVVETEWLSFGIDDKGGRLDRYIEASRWAAGRGIEVRAVDPLGSRRDCELLHRAMELEDRIGVDELAERLSRLRPYLDRRLTLVAMRGQAAAGMIMALRDSRSRAVRIATAHVREGGRRTPVLVALVGRVLEAIAPLRPSQLTASVIDRDNAASIAVVRGAGGKHLRTVCQYSIALDKMRET